MLDVRRLRVLREVAACGSFSAAAERLAFTQPAISPPDRDPGGGGRDPPGGALRPRGPADAGRRAARRAHGRDPRPLAAAESQLATLADGEGGRLRIGAIPTVNATLLPMTIAALRTERPGLELRLAEGPTMPMVERLLAGEVDVVIVADEPVLRADERLAVEWLMDDPVFLALPLDHPLADRAVISVADLRDETFIEGGHPGCTSTLRTAAAAAGFEPRIAFEAAEWLGRQGLVAAGVGLTLIPSVALATVRDDVLVRALSDAPVRPLVVVTLAGGYVSPAVEPLRRILRRVASEHCFTCDGVVR
jgi:DNA-binding transcriptional LysR family regulator